MSISRLISPTSHKRSKYLQPMLFFRKTNAFFLNERARDCAYFIDIEVGYNRLAGKETKGFNLLQPMLKLVLQSNWKKLKIRVHIYLYTILYWDLDKHLVEVSYNGIVDHFNRD